MELIPFLVWALILLVVLYVVSLIMDRLRLPADVKTIAWLIIGLVVLILLLRKLGVNVGL